MNNQLRLTRYDIITELCSDQFNNGKIIFYKVIITSLNTCNKLNGTIMFTTYNGDNVFCSNVPCNSLITSCILPNKTCYNDTLIGCFDNNGISNGYNTACQLIIPSNNFTLCPFSLGNLTNISILASTTITTANPTIVNNGNIGLTP